MFLNNETTHYLDSLQTIFIYFKEHVWLSMLFIVHVVILWTVKCKADIINVYYSLFCKRTRTVAEVAVAVFWPARLISDK